AAGVGGDQMDGHGFASFIRLEELSEAVTHAASGKADADGLHASDTELLSLLQFRPLRFGCRGIVLAIACITSGRRGICTKGAIVGNKGILSLDKVAALGAAKLGFELFGLVILRRQIGFVAGTIVFGE